MRTERNKRACNLGALPRSQPDCRAMRCGASGPASEPPIQPLVEGTGGASGAAAPFDEAGVSLGGSGLAGV